MSTSPIRIAVVGLDHWYGALPFVQAITAHEGTTLVGISDDDLDRAQPIARHAGVDRLVTEPQELIEDSGVDVVASFSSIDRNPAICIAAARSGKHVLSIKPVARTLPEATQVLQAVRETGVTFLPAESRGRLSSHASTLKQWISEGRLGQIRTASFSLWAGLPQGWQGDKDPGWFTDPARAPGGGWIDHSIYHIDLLRWLLGDEIIQISGWAGNLKYPDLPMEDYGTAIAVFGDGVVATLEDTWHGLPGAFRSQMSLVGDEGAVVLDSLSGRLSVVGSFPPFNGWVHTAPLSSQSDGLEHLLAIIRGEQSPIATADDAWRNLAACRAFYAAAESGTVGVPEQLPGSVIAL
jgi:predicted dehydrogenase